MCRMLENVILLRMMLRCHTEGPELPPDFSKRSDWAARMVERHCWFRVLLHLAVIARRRRNVRWHLACIWREIHELLHAK